ncbi:MAG: hypothetical protein BWY15_00425 [Firmicutes bacterium ADurb.Bin193]|nr:MAG: hypothetical protein BWY15_00425 [Firmicutes bacterium ADurb.Bin193]
MNSYLKAEDTVNGRIGCVWLNLRGVLSELVGLVKFEAKDNVETSDFKTVGTTKTQTKVKGVSGKGTIEMQYHGVSIFSGIVQKFRQTGVLDTFSLTVENNDPNTSLGVRTVTYTGCTLDGDIPSALLDSSAEDGMTISIGFKYTDCTVLKDFSEPANIGRD